jgi:hypothetical protein
MKGDFSRRTFDPKKHYSGVLMQQGRVQVDADWNEQQAINQHRIETEAIDVIGLCGAPQDNAGFGIVVDFKDLPEKDKKLAEDKHLKLEHPGDFIITSGRYYVDGILCENDAPVLASNQPDLKATGQPPNLISPALPTQPGIYLVYLDVWQRHITALDDAHIREIALGGPDTATRIKTVWQVKIFPTQPLTPILVGALNGIKFAEDRLKLSSKPKHLRSLTDDLVKSWREFFTEPTFPSKIKKPFTEASNKIKKVKGSFNVRKEKIGIILGGIKEEILKPSPPITCDNLPPEWDKHIASSTGTLNARTVPSSSTDNLCLIPPSAGYQRLENQLYRVEIHKGGPLDTATFKWSRDNGSVVTTIKTISGQEITVDDVGRDEVLGFDNGQWAEVIDDLMELRDQGGQLVQIDTVNSATKKITIKAATPVPAVDLTQHPKLRRWDSDGAIKVEVPASNDGWIRLEGGIEVQFSEGTYKTGDYWLIPARTATGEIEWPNPIPQPPWGIQHHYCPLALINFDGEKVQVIEPCRQLFPPLTSIKPDQGHPPPSQVWPAIKKIGWKNDQSMKLTEFNKGLIVDFTERMNSNTASMDTFIVTLELVGDLDNVGNAQGRRPFIVNGKVEIVEINSNNFSQWKFTPYPPLNSTLLMWDVNGKLSSNAREPNQIRCRVVLKGNAILDEKGKRPLDGEAFGVLRGDKSIDLDFPSGDGNKGGDFESWFYLVPND